MVNHKKRWRDLLFHLFCSRWMLRISYKLKFFSIKYHINSIFLGLRSFWCDKLLVNWFIIYAHTHNVMNKIFIFEKYPDRNVWIYLMISLILKIIKCLNVSVHQTHTTESPVSSIIPLQIMSEILSQTLSSFFSVSLNPEQQILSYPAFTIKDYLYFSNIRPTEKGR